MKKKGTPDDPKGLIAEAYKIDGIGIGECRSIFLDWALSLPRDAEAREHVEALLARHGQEGHPMTEVLREGLSRSGPPRRRGGASGRRH
ncbi:hypothetical protein [Salipiger abyssi]|uniref:Uncharacterized protein n=1 Tax=Salipiger abyssi TaxID=1250539 RepID=A0A1P8UXU6_9RHOB|nr:hypothetical protein [Salipiger abyssi]APZ54210.1 hypothetical protein Ga0080574_TMP3876 [Salipiger abyssi]